MNYINQTKKRLVGRNNQPLNCFIDLDYHVSDQISFQFINDKNQIQEIPYGSYYFAGAIILPNNKSELLFLSRVYNIYNKTITFKYNTYTTSFLELIKRKNTQINIEIGYKIQDYEYLLLRDYALVNPRAYIEGVSPSPVTDYYTKEEIDSMLTMSAITLDLGYRVDDNAKLSYGDRI